MGRSQFADDGMLWKRGRNIKYIVRKVQEEINQVENGVLNFQLKRLKLCFLQGKRLEEIS